MLRVALHESMEVWDEHESVGEILLVNVSIKVVSLLKETSQCPVPFPIYSASTISILLEKLVQTTRCCNAKNVELKKLIMSSFIEELQGINA